MFLFDVMLTWYLLIVLRKVLWSNEWTPELLDCEPVSIRLVAFVKRTACCVVCVLVKDRRSEKWCLLVVVVGEQRYHQYLWQPRKRCFYKYYDTGNN
jgi:hypothetical protein